MKNQIKNATRRRISITMEHNLNMESLILKCSVRIGFKKYSPQP